MNERMMNYTAEAQCSKGGLGAIAGVTPVARKPVASDIAEFAEKLANRANSIADRLQGKLQSVMISDRPSEGCCNEIQDREYPPLFSDLRNNFNSISRSLDSIEYAIQRTEL